MHTHPDRNRAPTPERSADVASSRTGDTTLILNVADGHSFSLDEVGSRVWELADGTRSIAEITSILADEYAAPSEDIGADVDELFEELAGAGLVTFRAP